VRISSLDLGSNSFHLIVVKARLDGSFVPLVAEKAMLRLGDRVARYGSIGEDAIVEALTVLTRFKAISDAQRADEVVAVGTSALREATDGVEFIERVRHAAGIEVELIDGVEEAKLIFLAVRASVLIDRPPALAADLGGGSLEIVVGDQGGLYYAASARLGVGRLTAELVTSDPPSAEDRRRLDERIARELAPVLAEVREFKPKMLIGSSGTFVCLARMAAAGQGRGTTESMNQLTVCRADLLRVREQIDALPSVERARLPGCDQRRAELLPAGIAVLDHLMAATDLAELTVSEWALREGIVIRAIGAHDRADLAEDPRAIRRASILSLCRRSNWRQPHARQVALLAVQLFDAMSPLHELATGDRELLELSALAHDIGEHVSRNDHDRHTAYLIENGGLRGFSPEEVRILSALGRFHIRGNPRPGLSEAYAALDDEARRRAVRLTAILRLADALDATHGAVVSSLTATPDVDGHWRVVITARGDAELEQWTFRRKKDLFERTFEVTCDVAEVSTGRDDYEEPETLVAGLG
jgi:exopolyphosphatase/guanosine-5'-triphosphate,3'-diphosphate pyrophosphatase